MKLLIATRNRGKKREYAKLLEGLEMQLITLDDLGVTKTIKEDGASYTENALLKARGYAAATGLVTLADDSGLEVDALDGAPGVLTARYAGQGATDEQRYSLLLKQLKDVPHEHRTARFRCVIALAWPDGRVEITEGICEGRITREPRGEHGFGYDPVFYVPEYGCTMAELPPEIKNRISHRARAAAAASEILSRRPR
ncbi:MAG TPA: XTP/dITP diphosphatase [Anaerolineae bacterium]|nr:XTP/dITP diphosphatase [Anaerolineae bacterium]